jgi:uncharacterized ubiquitin-like protein YukD
MDILQPNDQCILDHSNLVGANGKELDNLGISKLNWTIDHMDHNEEYPFRVINQLPVPILLGVDWLGKYKAKIDLKERSMTIKIDEDEITTHLFKEETERGNINQILNHHEKQLHEYETSKDIELTGQSGTAIKVTAQATIFCLTNRDSERRRDMKSNVPSR